MEKTGTNLPQNTQVMSSSSLSSRAPCSPAAPMVGLISERIPTSAHFTPTLGQARLHQPCPSKYIDIFLLRIIIQVKDLRRTMTLVDLAPQSWLPTARAAPSERSQQARSRLPSQSLPWTQNFNNWHEDVPGRSTQEIPSAE